MTLPVFKDNLYAVYLAGGRCVFEVTARITLSYVGYSGSDWALLINCKMRTVQCGAE